MQRLWLWALAWVAILGLSAAAAAPGDGLQPIPPLQARVTDLTGTLSAAERGALEAKLADWETRTTNQLVVLIVPTTQPEAIEAYSIRVAEAWKIGQKGKDNGAILLVAKNDKKMRIEVGYGLEGVLTDLTSHRIISETIAPQFAQGQFAAGLEAGVDRIISVADSGEPLPAPAAQRRPARHGFDFGTLALILLVAVPAIGAVLRSILGNVGGSVAGAGIVGGAAWLFAGSLIIAGVAAFIAFIVISFSVLGRGGPGLWFPGRRRLRRRRWRRRILRRRRRLRWRRCFGRMVSMVSGKPQRLGRHFITDHHSVRRRFSAHALKRIEEAIAAGERHHVGQVRFIVEASLPLAQVLRGLTPRERALELFGRFGVWDTEHNSGVLVYVLLADKSVEIVADRGINRKIPPDTWKVICRAMESAFRDGRFEEGAITGINAIGELLAQHFPRSGSDAGGNELPDAPIVL